MIDDIGFANVDQVRNALIERELSVADIAKYFLERIRRIDRKVNAWITLDEAAVEERARELDQDIDSIQQKPLFGVPIAIKDLTPTSRFRTTFGSTIYKDYRPRHDALVVERLEAAGALVLGKTNTPEFGAGGDTVNDLSGATRNPWDAARTVGGSSGGSAAALASGMCILAEGSDYGGSLRVPAAFCGVLGFRTTPGLIPTTPADFLWDDVSVTGPMARTVADLEAMLSVIAGATVRAPLSQLGPSNTTWRSAEDDGRMRLACSDCQWLVDLDPEVKEGFHASVDALKESGCEVIADAPDLSGIEEVIRVLRPYHKAMAFAHLLDEWGRQLHPGLVADIERGLRLSAADVGRAQRLRSGIYSKNIGFWEKYDAFVMPTVPCKPFLLKDGAPFNIGGSRFSSYSDWMVLTQSISMLGWPALSVPSRLSESGMPRGVQLVGVQGTDHRLLSLANRYEQVMKWSEWRPPGLVDEE